MKKTNDFLKDDYSVISLPMKTLPKKLKYNGILLKQTGRSTYVVWYEAYWKRDFPYYVVALVFKTEVKTKKNELIVFEIIKLKDKNREALWATNDYIKAKCIFEMFTDKFEPVMHEYEDTVIDDNW